MASVHVLLPGTHTCPSITVTAAVAMAMGRRPPQIKWSLLLSVSPAGHQNLPVSSTLLPTLAPLESSDTEARVLACGSLRGE